MEAELMSRIEANSTWEPNTGCRLWLGALNKDHGLIKWRGKMESVHRIAWAHACGRELSEIPKGLFVLHKCGVSLCSNPEHLYLGTRLQNAADRRKHGGYQSGWQGSDPKRVFDSPFKRTTRPAIGIPTADELRAALSYDPSTGEFRWRARQDREQDWNTRWAGEVAGAILPVGYRYIKIGGKLQLAHRLAWLWMTGEWPEAQIDHINRDRTDNRWENLREATNQQNQLNTGLRSTNKSGVTGVSWSKKARRWYAAITVDGRMKNLGFYEEIADAIAARVAAEQKYRAA